MSLGAGIGIGADWCRNTLYSTRVATLVVAAAAMCRAPRSIVPLHHVTAELTRLVKSILGG
jgi:hypothetical protein